MTIRVAALRAAQSYVGRVKENPPYSNRGSWIDIWNRDACGVLGVPWCASFTHACFWKAGFKLPGGASVAKIRAAAQAEGWIVKRPRKGDLACFDFNEGSRYGKFGDHIGFVERVLALRWKDGRFAGFIRTVEGNTSAQSDLHGSQSDGGGVYRRWRWMRGISAEFVRVPGNVK